MTSDGTTPPADSTTPSDVPDPVTATADEHGTLTAWSTGAQRLLGYPAEAVLGRPASELLADSGDTFLQRLGRQRRWSGPIVLRHRDGSEVTGELHARRRVAPTGTDWLLVWRDAHQEPPARGAFPISWCFQQVPSPLAVFDLDLRYVWTNDGEETALALTGDQLYGLRLAEAVPHPDSVRVEHAQRRVARTGRPEYLEAYVQVAGENREHSWTIHLAPLTDPAGRLIGVGFAAQDTTAQYEARQRLTLLNEAGTRIGTSLDIALTAQQLADLAVPRFADYACVDLLTGIEDGDEPPTTPVTGPVTLRRTAQRSILRGTPESSAGPGAALTVPEGGPALTWLAAPGPVLYQRDDPDLVRWAEQEPGQGAPLRELGAHSVLAVPLRARGATLGSVLFVRHRRPDPFVHDDLLLAQELAARTAVCVDNARLYTLERTTAVTLQESLMPQRLAEQTAIEASARYLPASAQVGIGGDWFDVIPLSGARVALVIGDVVGHGVQASATMGRLRTAVRTLADIDLPPDELLTHLDDLVLRLTAESPDSDVQGDIGATCLYAVYDPVTRRCALARAGHLPPVICRPDGTVDFLDLPEGPPLGLGGLPFEAMEVELPEGTTLALYTDGLIERRDSDPDERLQALREALAEPAGSLQETCDTVMSTMLTSRHDDDVALLLARTRVLPADRVAVWEVADDPTSVAQARKDASAQLAEWGLDDLVFVTELVVSELVTNAIRYGEPPIRMRLIHDRALICEVQDSSSTAPHLKRARTYDEGGRGLLLVAQLTQRWGTRYNRNGKTIWAEQDLPDPSARPAFGDEPERGDGPG
ncbi:SpoIIE family protein phosphatase [Streptomyces sp. NPDC048717]|uniref:SpoIIE family protein phosphatase n=1 Tax=Streptomyces sp. NPDC048717 TaxID=3154928 RepID=UPI003414CDDE